MREKPVWLQEFIGRMQALADPANPDRRQLAELRRCRGDETGRVLYRLGSLFRGVPIPAEDDAILVACMFSSHWENSQRDGVNLGQAMRQLLDATKKSESIARRFASVLDSEREDLPNRLRHVIALLKSKGIGLDWAQLLDDLRWWNSDKRTVQRRWARAFWSEAQAEEESVSPAIVIPASE